MRRDSGWPERLGLLTNLLPFTGLLLSFLLFAPALEDRAIEWRLRVRPPTPLDTNLALVGLDERTALSMALDDGTPKPYLARIVRAVARARPSVIALDFRIGPREVGEPGGLEFARTVDSVSGAGVPVVLPAILARHGSVPDVVYAPPPAHFGNVYSGYVSFAAGPEAGGAFGQPSGEPVLPRLAFFDRLGSGDLTISFPALVAALHLGHGPPIDREVPGAVSDSVGAHLARALRLAPPEASDAEAVAAGRRPRHIDYAGPVPYGGVLSYFTSAEELLADPAAVSGWMRGRIVLIAAVYPSPDGDDEVRTPYGRVRGGVVLLHAMDSLLRRPRLWVAPGWVALVFVVGAVLCVTWVWSQFTPARAFAWALGLGVTFVLSAYLFGVLGYFLPMVWPIGAGITTLAFRFVVTPPPSERSGKPSNGRGRENRAPTPPEGRQARAAVMLPPEAPPPWFRRNAGLIWGLVVLALWGFLRRK